MSSFVVTRSGASITKDPDAVLDYVVDATEFLADGDTLKVSPLTVTVTGLTKGTTSVNAAAFNVVDEGGVREIAPFKAVVIWLSGGVAGTTGLVHTRMETQWGRTIDVSFRVAVREG